MHVARFFMKSFGVAVICCTLIGCECGEKSQPETRVEAPALAQEIPYKLRFPQNDWQCNEDSVRRAEEWMDIWLLWRGRGPNPAEVSLNLVTYDGQRLEEMPRMLVELGLDLLRVDGMEISLDQVTGKLEEKDSQRRREARLLNKPLDTFPMTVALAVDPGVETQHVHNVIAEMMAETEISFVFRAPPMPSDLEPPPADLLGRLNVLGPNFDTKEDFVRLGEKWREAQLSAVQDCTAFGDLQDEIGKSRPDKRWLLLKDELADVWLACRCKLDLELLVGMYHVYGHSLDPPLTSITITLDPDGFDHRGLPAPSQSSPLDLPPTSKWEDIIPALKNYEGKKVRLK